MGHGPRGLLAPTATPWDVPAPRPRPLARLPLGRGRPARHLRRPRPAVLRARALERGRPDPQGARCSASPGAEGNHGEDVKEVYWYLDATPTHSYLQALYRYPQRAFPYARPGRARTGAATATDPEYELRDTGVFDGNRFFDVDVEYAKADADDILIRITVTNRGPIAAPLHLLPTLWFRNTLGLGPATVRPTSRPAACQADRRRRRSSRPIDSRLGECAGWPRDGDPRAAVHGERDERRAALRRRRTPTPYVKDAFHAAVVDGPVGRCQPCRTRHEGGRLVPLRHRRPARPSSVLLPPAPAQRRPADPFAGADALFERAAPRPMRSMRRSAARSMTPERAAGPAPGVRRAASGPSRSTTSTSREWLDGDPAQPPPPPERRDGRNRGWRELNNADVISMPDGWEYPWYAAWDLAFHCLPLAQIDPVFAKRQLLTLLESLVPAPERPAARPTNGTSRDVNPPVHAWAAWRVYKIDRRDQRASPTAASSSASSSSSCSTSRGG